MQKAKQAKNWSMSIVGALLMSTAASMLAGSRPAQARSCLTGEIVTMIDPVVTVIEGPGDAAGEQTQWSALEFSLLAGPLEMDLGEQTWDLEPVP